jgi:tetratricopeptide (TPR) repeat protein
MNNTKKEVLSYLDNVSLFLLGIFFLAFPLLFISPTLMTDAFTLPKQALMAGIVVLSIIVLSIRMIVEGRVRLRATPFDLPVFLFLLATFLSTIFAVNRYDSLIAFVPLFFVVLLYYVITNVVRGEKPVMFIDASLVLGTTLSTLLSILSFFKIYLLPLAYTKTQAFTPFGSLLDQAIFLAIVLPIAGYVAWPVISPLFAKKASNNDVFGDAHSRKATVTSLSVAFTVAFALLIVGLIFTVYMLVTSQKPLILPFTTGFQTAFAAISQDAGRILQGFLFGSGYGTYVTDFTRFKQAAYNANQALWSFTFFRSSSYILELLATTGFLGLASFLFIVYRVVKEKSFFLPIVLAIVAAFILPFSLVLQALFFIVLAIFAVLRANHAPARYADLEFYLVTLKHGLILAQPEGERAPHDPVSTRYGKILPFTFVVIILAIVGYVGFWSVKYLMSDLTFTRSLVAASQNNGTQTYNLQRDALAQFPYRDLYYTYFSQTNLALANSLAASQPKGASPSADVQQQVVGLIQQSINAGRSAVTISPQTATNWDNLSQTYRSLIGFGQNADQFAVLTNQQAIALDPSNPQQYVNLGGIYYQLQLWDDAARQFQLAANLKPDYANAYYNLAHALESKGDLQNALVALQSTQSLVTSDKANADKVKKEIEDLKKKIASGQTAPSATSGQANAQQQAAEQQGLNVNQPQEQLPAQQQKEEIPAPPKNLVSPTPTPAKGAAVTPSPTK